MREIRRRRAGADWRRDMKRSWGRLTHFGSSLRSNLPGGTVVSRNHVREKECGVAAAISSPEFSGALLHLHPKPVVDPVFSTKKSFFKICFREGGWVADLFP